jgi:hypothetical protein
VQEPVAAPAEPRHAEDEQRSDDDDWGYTPMSEWGIDDK